MNDNKKIILKPLISEFDLKRRMVNLVKEVSDDVHDNEIVIIGLLKGSFIFLADLVRLFFLHKIPLVIDFVMVSSYGSEMESSGNVELIKDISIDIKDRWVLIVDDILDTGRTMDFIYKRFKKRKPAIMKTCVLTDKPDRRIVPFNADYIGFTIPDEFVVGYGLDYNNKYREQPFISTVIVDR
jgi:hypoxanthine phosphoribosyltransferase